MNVVKIIKTYYIKFFNIGGSMYNIGQLVRYNSPTMGHVEGMIVSKFEILDSYYYKEKIGQVLYEVKYSDLYINDFLLDNQIIEAY